MFYAYFFISCSFFLYYLVILYKVSFYLIVFLFVLLSQRPSCCTFFDKSIRQRDRLIPRLLLAREAIFARGRFSLGGHEEWKQLFYLIKLKLYLSHSPEAFLFVSGACAGFQFFFFKCKIYIVHYAGFVISRWKCKISGRDCAESSLFLRKCTIYSLLCAGILFFLHKCKILI